MPVSGLPVAAEITLDALLQERRRVFVEHHRRPQQQPRVHSPVDSPELRHQQSAIRPTYRPLQKEAPESSVARREESRGEDSGNEAPTTPNK